LNHDKKYFTGNKKVIGELMPKITIPEGYTLIVEGEASFRVLGGELRAYGSILEADREYTVEPLRAVPLYALKDSEIDLYTGRVSFVKGDTVPPSREEVFRILEKDAKKIMIVGGLDSGKTSVATFLANKFAEKGEKVAVVDADIGQKSIGPPTTIGLGIIERPVLTLSEAHFIDGFFVGNITPAGLLHRHVAGVKLLVDKAEDELKADRIIIDTTGWVTELEGRELKLFKALVAKPDVALIVSRPYECIQMEKILGQVTKTIRIDVPQFVKARDRVDRKEYRKYQYKKYLANAKTTKVSFVGRKILYTMAFTGNELGKNELTRLEYILGGRVHYAEMSDDHVSIFSEKSVPEEVSSFLKAMYGHRRVRIMTGAEFMHTLVGISGDGKMLKGIGIISGVDLSSRSFEVLSNVDIRENDAIMFGLVKVNPLTFEEETIIEKNSIF
jgi:polynucleotide 5'-hydroxyl-kinase GRC3/NOL9